MRLWLDYMGPVLTLFVWFRHRNYHLHLNWPCPSHTGAGKWAW